MTNSSAHDTMASSEKRHIRKATTMQVRKITHNAEPIVKTGKRGRPKGSKNKVNDIPEYRYRCKSAKCGHQFTINIKAFFHTCPKCHGATDCTNAKGILK